MIFALCFAQTGKAMRKLRTVLAACCVLGMATAAQAAETIDYSVTVTGVCKSQMFMGWDDCQQTAVYTMFKSGRYMFHFVDKYKNTYSFSGSKEREMDLNSLYSNIDTMDATIDGKKIVDSQAMGGCNTKLSPDSDKFIYIDCTVSNSKGIPYKFRMNDITYVERALSQ
jgi:hypothetical protein